MKEKFIEWFTKNNNGCSPAMEDDRGFVHEKAQHMFEAYLAGVAEGEARSAALAAEVYDLKHPGTYLPSKCETPALDAFLAEVRAQGVEMLAEKLREHIAVDSSGSTRARALTRIVDRASDQIRKGVQS